MTEMRGTTGKAVKVDFVEMLDYFVKMEKSQNLEHYQRYFGTEMREKIVITMSEKLDLIDMLDCFVLMEW